MCNILTRERLEYNWNYAGCHSFKETYLALVSLLANDTDKDMQAFMTAPVVSAMKSLMTEAP